MLDITGIVTGRLRSELALDHIYAENAPAGATVPFAVVRPDSYVPLFADVDTWSLATLLIDVIGDPDDMAELRTLVADIQRTVREMRGMVIGGVVFQSIVPIAAAFSYDPTYTPSLPRWVLTASMTVRSNTPEGVVVWHSMPTRSA